VEFHADKRPSLFTTEKEPEGCSCASAFTWLAMNRRRTSWPTFIRPALRFDIDLTEGIEHAPGAIASLSAGENLGKKLIYVG
jgi:NADPH-dependent curcumin reductase CurA